MNETTEPTQAPTPTKVWDYLFHTETSNGYVIVKINADSKEKAIEMAYEKFQELGSIWNPTMPVYAGKFAYEYHGEDVDITTERGEVVDFSSI